jgi:AhpD family alkylhydroperoxidase
MKQFNIPQRADMDTMGQSIYDNIEQGLGFVPNLYLGIGHSSNAWAGYMALQASNGNGTFTMLERDAIQLVVSEANQSPHCVAAHTQLAIGEGFTEAETLELRAATSPNPRLKAITQLAKEIVLQRGKPTETTLDFFFAKGFDEKALVDLVMMIADKTIMNYVENMMQFPFEFAAAKPISG